MYNDSLSSAVDGADGEIRETGHGTAGSGRGSSNGARARNQHHWEPKFSSSWRNAFSAGSSGTTTTTKKNTTKSIIPLLLLLALATLSTRLFSLPLNRVIESRYCAAYYHSSPSQPPPPEEQCKIDWVQRRLAWLQGVIETAVIGVDLGVAVPAAWVGDRWKERGRGRRVVLAANLLGWAGVVLWVVIVGHLDGVLPVSAMAAAPFFALIGGHDCVLNSAVFAIVTDLTDDLVQRTSYIAYVTSVNYVVSLFGPSLASAAMTVNLWLPFYLSIAFLIAALPVVYFLPLDNEKSHASSANRASSSLTAAKRDDEDNDVEAAPLLRTASSSFSSSSSSQSPPSPPLPLKARLTHLVQQRPRFLLLLVSFLLTSLASSNTHLLPQYMSARYQRSFASVGPLLSLKAATNIVLLTLVVPVGMRVLLRRRGERRRRRRQRRCAAISELDRRDPGESKDDDGVGRGRGGGGGGKANTHTTQTIALNIDAALLSLLISVLGALCIAAAPTVPLLVAALLLYALGSALPVFTMALVDAVDHGGGGETAPREQRRDQSRATAAAAAAAAAAAGPLGESDEEQDDASCASPRRKVYHSRNRSSSGATARVYTVVMVVKTIGSLVGAPLMTAVWVAGIGVGGAGLGMPFWVSAALYLCAMGVIWCLKL